MKEIWEYVRGWCPKCDKEIKPSYEAKCRMRDGSIKVGSVLICNNIINRNKRTGESSVCGKRYFGWLNN